MVTCYTLYAPHGLATPGRTWSVLDSSGQHVCGCVHARCRAPPPRRTLVTQCASVLVSTRLAARAYICMRPRGLTTVHVFASPGPLPAPAPSSGPLRSAPPRPMFSPPLTGARGNSLHCGLHISRVQRIMQKSRVKSKVG